MSYPSNSEKKLETETILPCRRYREQT